MAKGKSGKGGKGKRPTSRKPSSKIAKRTARKATAKKKLVLAKPVVPPALRRPVKSRPLVVRMPAPRPAPHKAVVLTHLTWKDNDDYAPWVAEVQKHFSGPVMLAKDLKEF